MNKLTDPSRETGIAWQDIGSAQRRDDLGAHTGSWAGYLLARKDAFAGNQSSTQRQDSVALSIGVPHAASLWVNGDALGNTTINCEVDPGDGVFTVLGTLASAPPGWSLWEPGSIVAVGSTGRFQVTVPVPATDGSGYWLVDDLSLDDGLVSEMAKLRTIRDAIASRLASITVANGYSYDVATVFKGERPQRSVGDLPAIGVSYGVETAEVEDVEFHRMRKRAGFTLLLTVADDGSGDVAEAISADVEKVLTVGVGANEYDLSLNYVDLIVPSERRPREEPEESSRGTRTWELGYDVVYRHDWGSP